MRAAVIGSANLEHDGGGERIAVQAAKYLCELGYEVVIFGSGSEFDRSEQKNLGKEITYIKNAFINDFFSKKIVLRLTRGLSLGFIGFYTGKRFWNLIKGFDLYYFTIPGMLFRSFGRRLIDEGRDSQIILANHGTYYEILNSRRSYFFKLLQRILDFYILKPFSKSIIWVQTQNKFQRDYFVSMGYDPDRVKTIPQCDIPYNSNSIINLNGPFRVAFLGRLTVNKGVKLLIEIIKKSCEIEFDIIGDGPMKQELIELSRIHPGVRIHGFVSEDKKNLLLSRCDVMLNCSSFESLSISTVEGMMNGLVTLASETSTGHEYLNTLVKRSIIFCKRNPDSYYSKLFELKEFKRDDPKGFLELREGIREVAHKIFNQEHLANEIKKLLLLPASVKEEKKKRPIAF